MHMEVISNDCRVQIRKGVIDDAEALLAIQKAVVEEGEYLITAYEEFANNTVEQQEKWMERILGSDRETILVAETDSAIVGWLVFQSPGRKRLAHTGSFGMMIHRDFRGKGIGKILLGELFAWAEAHPLIEKISLGVFSTNHRAIALYKRMGFVEEGRKIKEIKLNENEYVDDVLMYKFV